MTAEDIAYVKKCISDHEMIRFYTWSKWLHIRIEVLGDDKRECQYCKANGIYTKATIVHHVKHIKQHPELALVMTLANGERQLVSTCKLCHEHQHPERFGKVQSKHYWPERWD